MLDFEDAVHDSILHDRVKPAGSLVTPGCQLWWSDIPVIKTGTTMIEFPRDIQMLIQELRGQSGLASSYVRRFYLRSEVSPGIHKIEQISEWLACLLRASDGRRNIGEVVAELDRDITELQESVREYAFVRLLAGAQEQGFIEIYRASPDDPPFPS